MKITTIIPAVGLALPALAAADQTNRPPLESAMDRPVLLAMATPPQSAPKSVPKTGGRVVEVAGIRGLNEAELRAAKYDAEQMKQLNGLAVTADEARKFAAEGALSSRKVAYLPKPASTQTSPRGEHQP